MIKKSSPSSSSSSSLRGVGSVPEYFPAVDETLACKLPHGWRLQELGDDEDGRLFESDIDVLEIPHGAIDVDGIGGVGMLYIQGGGVSVAATRQGGLAR